jgi:hypothetical protein
MTKPDVRERVEEPAIIPFVRAANDEDALFAAEAVFRGGWASHCGNDHDRSQSNGADRAFGEKASSSRRRLR